MLTKKRISAKGNVMLFHSHDPDFGSGFFDIKIERDLKRAGQKLEMLEPDELAFLCEILKDYYGESK